MSKQLLPDLSLYFHEIDEAIICKPDVKKTFFADFKERVGDFVAEHQPGSTEEVIAHFGRPEEIARAFFGTLDSLHIKKAMNRKKVAIVGVVAFLLIWSVIAIVGFINANNAARGHGVNNGVVENIFNNAEVKNEKNYLINNCTYAGNDSVFSACNSH